MKIFLSLALVFAGILGASRALPASPPNHDILDVLSLTSVPDSNYDVRLQLAGSDHDVTLAVKANRAAFVKASDSKLNGLSGDFERIGNGVFLVRMSGDNHRATQFWVFHPNGTATVREVPDRGEQQTATPQPGK